MPKKKPLKNLVPTALSHEEEEQIKRDIEYTIKTAEKFEGENYGPPCICPRHCVCPNRYEISICCPVHNREPAPDDYCKADIHFLDDLYDEATDKLESGDFLEFRMDNDGVISITPEKKPEFSEHIN